MRSLVLVLWALLALSGCAAPEFVWHADVTFTAEERAELAQALAWTSSHVGDPSPPRILYDLPHPADDQHGAEGTIIRREGATQTGGIEFNSVWAIELAAGAPGSTNETWFRVIAAHEFGHWYGLVHVSSGLMQHLGPQWTWSAEDAADCRANVAFTDAKACAVPE
jgi:hypothetical protein